MKESRYAVDMETRGQKEWAYNEQRDRERNEVYKDDSCKICVMDTYIKIERERERMQVPICGWMYASMVKSERDTLIDIHIESVCVGMEDTKIVWGRLNYTGTQTMCVGRYTDSTCVWVSDILGV